MGKYLFWYVVAFCLTLSGFLMSYNTNGFHGTTLWFNFPALLFVTIIMLFGIYDYINKKSMNKLFIFQLCLFIVQALNTINAIYRGMPTSTITFCLMVLILIAFNAVMVYDD